MKISLDSSKAAYRDFLQSQEEMPIFFQDWWLEAVCKAGKWEVLMVRDQQENILAVMPYYEKKRFGIPIISMPPLTPALGPWYPDGSSYGLGQEHRLLQVLLDHLPQRIYLRQKWMPQRKNWLPAHWQGFQPQTRYQHVIPELGNWKQVEKGCSSEVKRRARKASKSITIEPSQEIEAFYELLSATFNRQQLPTPVSLTFLKGLFDVLQKQNMVQLWVAKDKDQHWHAAQILVWDKHYLYSLASATHPTLRHSGAYQLLVCTVLRELGTLAPAFNFAGSMIYNIAKMNEAFGARPIPHALLTKYNYPPKVSLF